MNSYNLGIMQGRLIDSPKGQLDWFPQDSWEKEFYLASKCNLDYIEIVAEKELNKSNPIWNITGRNKILKCIKENNLKSSYLCFNYMMNYSILDKLALSQLKKIFSICGDLSINNIVMPFFDKSEILESNFIDKINLLNELSTLALRENISIHLETSLSGNLMMEFVNNIKCDNIYILVDTGNYFYYDFDLVEDIKQFNNLIGHIHIKDRNVIGDNVILGNGGVDFSSFFNALKDISYNGNYTFETTRGNNAIDTANSNRLFFKKLLS